MLKTGRWSWEFSKDAMVWDAAMHHLFGLEPDSFGGGSDDFLNHVHKGDRAYVANSMAASVESGIDFEAEFRVIGHDGCMRSLLMKGVTERGADGKTHGMSGTCEPASKENASGLTASMERTMFAALMDNLPDCIYFKDMNSRMIVASRSNAHWFGLDNPQALIGKTDFDLFTDEHARQAMEDELEILETGRPIFNIEEKETWPDGHVTYVSTSKMPLRDERGRIIGTFGLSHDITERKQAEEQLAQFAEELQHRNEILEEELAMARELQLAMLPQRFPSFFHDGREAVRFSHFFQPSTTVSGDFFNVYEISQDLVGIFICDVMGHGVGASLIAATARALIEERTFKGMAPAALLADLNASLRRVLKHNSSPFFVTACYLVADLSAGELIFANAGHPRPILSRVGGTAALESVTGPVLGLFDGAVYENVTCRFAPGDRVFFFTDGLFEVENPAGEVFDYPRLAETIGQRRELTLNELCRSVVEEVQKFSETREFSDDVCLLGVELA